MKIFVDFDDTIVDSVENVIRIANNRYGQKVTIDDIAQWSFDGVYDGIDGQDIVDIFYEDDFFKTLKAKNHAIVTLSKLSARNEIIIATKTTTKGFEKKYQLPVSKNPCPIDGSTKREYIKQLIKQLNTENPGVKKRLFRAIQDGSLEGWSK